MKICSKRRILQYCITNIITFVVKKIVAMKNKSSQIDLLMMKERIPIDSIGDDIILLNDISMVPFFDYPTKIDYAVACICLKGSIEGTINLKPVSIAGNDTAIILPGQIIQYSYISDDFSGLMLVMSERFIDNLEISIKDSVSVLLYLKENHVIRLAPDEAKLLLKYYDILLHTVRMPHITNRLEIIRLLLHALFHIINDFRQLLEESNPQKTKREWLFDAFYNLVLAHYKESRKTEFYAEKLCLTPKYLSAVIKETTGKSVTEWITNYVILEAKSLLKTSNMTIQQISDELHFANQSFFGKFFKRITGTSPKEYKRKG